MGLLAYPRVVGLIDVAADLKTLAAAPSRRLSGRFVMLQRRQGLARRFGAYLCCRKLDRVRPWLPAGGRWIRTSGSWSRDRQTVMGEVTAFSKPGADLLGNRRFESISLQRGVKRTPESRLATSEYDTGVDQGSRGWLSAVGSGAPSSARGPLSCCRCQMSRQPCRSRSTLMVTRVRCARRSTAWRLAASC